MITPTIHANGTSRAVLLQQCLDACAGIDAACMAMAQARPHGCDYYPQGDDAIAAAEDEWLARIERLRAVRREMEELANAIIGDPAREHEA
jgi:hypothetical protein